MRRKLAVVALGAAALALVGWRHQAMLVGATTRWYLSRIAAREQATGDLTRRREVVARLNRALLLPPPPDGMVAELFELVTQMSDRTARGEISPAWFAYLYTSYERDLVRDRPDGAPARTADEVRASLEATLAFFSVRGRPDEPGSATSDSYTREQIDQAARDGRTLPLR